MNKSQFQMLARFLANKINIKCVPRKNLYNWAVDGDGQTIYYPDTIYYSDKDFGLLIHEAAHIRFSNFDESFKKVVQTIVTATDGATVTFDLSLGNIQQVTLAGNRTLALSNVSVGQCFILNLIQDATGSRTVTFFTTIKWADSSEPILTTTANKTDSLGFICVSTGNYLAYIVGQNI